MAGVEDEHVAEALELSRLVMEISNALVDLGFFPIQDVPPTSKISLGGFGGGWSHSGVPVRGTCLQRRSLGLNLVRLPSL
jgi:hypothetical protein